VAMMSADPNLSSGSWIHTHADIASSIVTFLGQWIGKWVLVRGSTLWESLAKGCQS
jgi:hypothetical protein